MAKIYKFIFFFKIYPCVALTYSSQLSFRHGLYLVRVVIHVNWLVYLACLLSHVLRAYCNFESKQAISISLFGRRPNNNVFPMRINGVCVAVQFYILGLNFLYFCFGNGNEWYGFETKKVKPRIKMNHIINNLNKGVYLKLNHWIMQFYSLYHALQIW